MSGNTLEIDYRTRQKSFWEKTYEDGELTKIYITLPHISKMKVKGAGKIRLNGFYEDNLDINLTGAMTCDANLHSNHLDVEMTGPMVFEIDGDGDFLQADITGVAQLKASGFSVRHAIISAHGMATAKVNAHETVEIDKDLTSSVKYQGNPEVIKRD